MLGLSTDHVGCIIDKRCFFAARREASLYKTSPCKHILLNAGTHSAPFRFAMIHQKAGGQ